MWCLTEDQLDQNGVGVVGRGVLTRDLGLGQDRARGQHDSGRGPGTAFALLLPSFFILVFESFQHGNPLKLPRLRLTDHRQRVTTGTAGRQFRSLLWSQLGDSI